ncbi:hypothetical protein INT46_011491 [Mucor plumbeus]|uniref:Uncharacterized protein n=1 Tax=Mucor plumbeus TaxID=97098 RepID=A0A8H7VA80_9FUNG|nr:hypothetical protein INT46_011491 [Mucor plumbeus]
MSVIKTKCPNLSDLSKVLGPIDGVGSKKPSKPLCENIFDVQRSELFEVLESLRNSFWNDQIITETLVQQPQFEPSEEPPMSPSKRTRDSDEEDFLSENESSSKSLNSKKRARMSTPEGTYAKKKHDYFLITHYLYSLKTYRTSCNKTTSIKKQSNNKAKSFTNYQIFKCIQIVMAN